MKPLRNPLTLIHGDCLEVMRSLADSSVDLILCDLPYGTTACRWDVVIAFEPLWDQYWRLLKSNGAVVLFGSQPFTTKLIASQIEHFKYEWVWEKQRGVGHLNARKRPLISHENILVFYRAQPTYNPQGLVQGTFKNDRPVKTKDKHEFYSKEASIGNVSTFGNYPKTVLRFDKDVGSGSKKRFHPTQKPVALLEYLINTYTRPGDVVLDNCMGSGSTGVAALRTGRRFIGIEKNRRYFEIARKRLLTLEDEERSAA